jgi:hypothetical protein
MLGKETHKKEDKSRKIRKRKTKVTKYWEIACATNSGINVTKRKSDRAQHMADRNKTQCTKGRVTKKMYDAPKNCSASKNEPIVGKEKIGRWGKKV